MVMLAVERAAPGAPHGVGAEVGLDFQTVAIPEVERAVLVAISDDSSRKIMASTIYAGKTIEEIVAETGVPPSTAYRRIHDLCERGVLVLERVVVTATGRRYSIYRSAFKDVKVDIEAGRLAVAVTPNRDVAEKLYKKWRSIIGPE